MSRILLIFHWCEYNSPASIVWVLASSPNGFPLWTTAFINLEDNAHPPSTWYSCACIHLPGDAHPAGFGLIHFLGGRIGALIGLFTHGLAIKKLLEALSHYQLYAIIIRRDTVIITACAERLKSSSNSAPYKSLCALEGGNEQIIGPFDILLILTVSS